MTLRTMKNTFHGHTFYESSFNTDTGVLTKVFDTPDNNSYGLSDDICRHVGVDHTVWRDKWGFRDKAFSPSPETVDIAITGWCNFGCTYCLSPETPILYTDMVWRPIGQAKVGDRIVAFDEFSSNRQQRKLRESVIEKVFRTVKPSFRITTDTTEVVTSADHKWLTRRGTWLTTSQLNVGITKLRSVGYQPDLQFTNDYQIGYITGMTLGDGTCRFTNPTGPSGRNTYWRVALVDKEPLDRLVTYLASVGVESWIRPFDPGNAGFKGNLPMQKVEVRAAQKLSVLQSLLQTEIDTDEYRRGFLAGFYDAEGSYSDRVLRISQNTQGPLRRAQDYAKKLGFSFCLEDRAVRFQGPLRDRIRFLGMIRPALSRKLGGWKGLSFESSVVTVNAIEAGPTCELIDIQTSTRTFFASGLATHNCYQDSTERKAHAPADLVERVIKAFDYAPYQVAIGGGEPTSHPEFPAILRSARALGTVPNFTTAGHVFRPEVIAAANEVCGGVSLTYHAFKGNNWFRDTYLKWREALDGRVALNVHVIADNKVADSMEFMLNLNRESQKALGYPISVILLAYYPNVGRAQYSGLMPKSVYMEKLPALIRRARAEKIQLAFSEGLLPYFLSRSGLGVETVFATQSEGRFSCYVDSKGRLTESSFNPAFDDDYVGYDGQPVQYKSILRGDSLQKIWDRLAVYGNGPPQGEACAGCPKVHDCATPDPTHYLSCAFAPHNRV